MPLTSGSCNVCMLTFNKYDPFSRTLTRHDVNLGPLLRLSPSACPSSQLAGPDRCKRPLTADRLPPDRQDARTAKEGGAYRNVRFYPCYVWYSSSRA